MNEKFLELSEEKQLKIINAAMEVFSQNEYKRASTEDIAAKAGISKGLLFYYFHNKKSLYLYLFEYSKKIIIDQVVDKRFSEITDFFELLEYAAYKKAVMFTRFPYLMEFVLQAYFSENEVISLEVQKNIQKESMKIYGNYFKYIDLSKFKEEIDFSKLINMLTWMAEGYLLHLKKQNIAVDAEKMMKEFKSWSDMFKKISYKEEYIDESH